MFTPYNISGSHVGAFVSVTIAALAPRCCQSIARARVSEHRPGRIRIQVEGSRTAAQMSAAMTP